MKRLKIVHRAAHLRGLVLLLALAGAACSDSMTPPVALPTEMSPAARVYLERVLDLMQQNSYKRLEIDWPAFRQEVTARAGTAQNVTELYPAIRRALELLADGHSGYYPVSAPPIFVPLRNCVAPFAPGPSIPRDIGYVRVPAFSGGGDAAVSYAEQLRNQIRSADSDSLIGWIVDLRGNMGGNMWPMLAGVGPVLGEGVVGWFLDPEGRQLPWEYRDNTALLNGNPVQALPQPYTLKRPGSPPVAVLIDNRVASSGEAIAIAFRERPSTRSFGTPTCGLSTANSGFQLSDGAILNLTVSVMADRAKQPYGESVPPDEVLDGTAEQAARAVEWLRSLADRSLELRTHATAH